MNDLKAKYSKLLRQADKRSIALNEQQKEAKKISMTKGASIGEIADYECAKAEYLAQNRVAQIYGQVTFDLEPECDD